MKIVQFGREMLNAEFRTTVANNNELFALSYVWNFNGLLLLLSFI